MINIQGVYIPEMVATKTDDSIPLVFMCKPEDLNDRIQNYADEQKQPRNKFSYVQLFRENAWI
jgi:hypothetical protein